MQASTVGGQYSDKSDSVTTTREDVKARLHRARQYSALVREMFKPPSLPSSDSTSQHEQSKQPLPSRPHPRTKVAIMLPKNEKLKAQQNGTVHTKMKQRASRTVQPASKNMAEHSLKRKQRAVKKESTLPESQLQNQDSTARSTSRDLKKSREAQTKDDCVNAKQSAPNPSVVPLEKDIELQTLATMDEKERKVEENDKRRENEGTQDGNNTPRSPYVSPRKHQKSRPSSSTNRKLEFGSNPVKAHLTSSKKKDQIDPEERTIELLIKASFSNAEKAQHIIEQTQSEWREIEHHLDSVFEEFQKQMKENEALLANLKCQ